MSEDARSWYDWPCDRCGGELEEVHPDFGGTELYCKECGWPDSALVPARKAWSRPGPWNDEEEADE